MNREEKSSAVDALGEKLAKAKIAIVTDYRGLTVSSFEELRRELKSVNAEIQVTKNSLLKLATKGTSFELINDALVGTTALTVSYEDPVSPAKILTKFSESNDALKIKIGCLDGTSLSVEDLNALSKLPSKEVLLGKLAATLNAVPTNFARALKAIPTKLVYALRAVENQKEQ